MKAFADEGFKRKDADLKDIRMILLGDVLRSKKPWEVLVGKAIGKLTEASPNNPDSISWPEDSPDPTTADLGLLRRHPIRQDRT